MDDGDKGSALRIYVGRNKVGLGLAAAILAALGTGGAVTIPRLMVGAEASSDVKESIVNVQTKLDRHEAEDVAIHTTNDEKFRRAENRAQRIDANVLLLCRALKVPCREGPVRPE